MDRSKNSYNRNERELTVVFGEADCERALLDLVLEEVLLV